MIRSALNRLLFRDRIGQIAFNDHDLRRAHSLVLHEHSDSVAVRTAASDAQRHAEAWHGAAPDAPFVDHDPIPPADIWLTATLGCPAALQKLARDQPSTPKTVSVDQPSANPMTTEFFRATATLDLPDRAGSVIVIAAIVRPGNRDLALFWDGPFTLPDDQKQALRALEKLIQSHVGQWLPSINLWSGGAESVLPTGEIRGA